ncbi:MAG: hypothetical protein RL119_842 [Actinomycetota bacterium]
MMTTDSSVESSSPWLNSRRKRIIDLAIAVLASVIALPIIMASAVGIRLTSPGSVFFRHQRAGLNGQPFIVCKLRTMRNVTPGKDLATQSDADRLTRFGIFLRRYSIDELPQLVNVLRGDMSIVGPRPLPMPYNTRYTPEQRRRLLARPGLTGLSQATTRNSSEWPQKLALDVEYIARASFLLDLKIILGTFRVVLTGSGVAAPGHATMPEFKAINSESDQ